MLIEFSVANYRSFNERQTLSLAMAKGNEHSKDNTFEVNAVNKFDLLRSAAIYGANASGKTNFLRSLQVMKEIVVNSASSHQRGDKLPITPFRLSEKTYNAPSEFETTFVVKNVRYQYGFTATENKIYEEWLLAYPKGRAQRWFSREWSESEQEYDWELGSNLLGEKQLWVKSTRENALFLSTAVQLNSKQLQPVYDWFKDTLRMSGVGGWGIGFSASLCEKKEKNKILEFIKAADLAINDIQVESQPFDPGSLPDDMPESIKDQISQDMKGKKVLDIKTIHKTSDGNEVAFDIDDESDGTQRLFGFAGPWVDSLANGYILFIDELHDNLHPKLVNFLVSLFHDKNTNPKNAQLIFTTHETSILNQDVFRRDQIWFCEKNKDQSTELYPLTDFSPRKGRENLELSYLSGRYGALPFIKSMNFKVEAK
ncbi:AAA family ATPase [Vreelandella massiliensis]|uniref:AAA family ATPase n=1 Tax=Vreelandella massiliensis TaxID=1816686 RepID=UPI00096A5C4D|nr:ATP-binding protein [Halomonas massiliensis]